MKYNEMSTDDVIKHINAELLKNRTMKDIEESDFEENKGVIQKRLNRKGYVKINNQFVSVKENTTKNTTKIIQKETSKIEGQKSFSNAEIEKLNKLLELDIDTLNNMITEYTTKNNTISSIDIKDSETTVTSVRLNKELYNKIKEYSRKENIKLQDIFNKMMMQYISENIK